MSDSRRRTQHAARLLWISVVLDLLGVFFGALLATQLRHHNFVLAINYECLIFCIGFLFLAWFFGAYSFLRWPWMPYRELVNRWLTVVGSAMALSVCGGWMLNVNPSMIWFHRSTLLILGSILFVWGLLTRRCLQPAARIQALNLLNRSPVNRKRLSEISPSAPTKESISNRQLMLLLVAYHPSTVEVDQLQACLSELPPQVGYAVVVNDHQPGEAVEQLESNADCFLINKDNPGYGRAVNRLVLRLGQLPPYIGVLNTDLSWEAGAFDTLLGWLRQHPDVSLALPQILDEDGTSQKLCKQHPTVLGLFSRRFVPDWFKPTWLKRYDNWYVMSDQNYQEVFEANYLSGCCMLICSDSFCRSGGFDERYFLYLEDADLTRTLARYGRCVHLPVASVTHGWGRGNYRNMRLMAVNLSSAWHYFRKWGWALW